MKSFLWKIYAYSFIDALVLIGAIFSLYFASKGLSTLEISSLIAIWSATVFLLEVPAGIVADTFPRRNLLIIASLCRGVGFLLWLLFPSYWGFAIGFIFWGLRNVFASGTFEAFLYDELKAVREEQRYEKVMGQISGYKYVALMISTILGGFIAHYSFALTLSLSVFSSIIVTGILLSIKIVKPAKEVEEIHSLVVLKNAIKYVIQTKKLLFIISFMCLVFGTYIAVDDFWPLILKDYGFNITQVGIFIAIVYATAALAGYTAHLLKIDKNKNSLIALILLGGFIYIIVGAFKIPFILALIFIGIYVLKVADIKFETILQDTIQSKQRATIFSIKSLLLEGVYTSVILLFGFISNYWGLTAALIIAGVLITSTTLIAWKYLSRTINS